MNPISRKHVHVWLAPVQHMLQEKINAGISKYMEVFQYLMKDSGIYLIRIELNSAKCSTLRNSVCNRSNLCHLQEHKCDALERRN